MRPATANAELFGDGTHEIAEVYHCGLTAGTCADFSQYGLDELMDIIDWQPLKDGTYEEMKDGTLLPHIDMKTVHPLLSHKYDGDMEEIFDENEKVSYEWRESITKDYFKDIDGNVKGVTYNKGEGMAMDFENLVYAHNATIKKLRLLIADLENRIIELEV
jgi:hypothetical protein